MVRCILCCSLILAGCASVSEQKSVTVSPGHETIMASIGSESKATVSRSETHPVVCTADSALLTWNAFSSPFDTIQYYELLFRNHGDTGWISLNDTIPTNDTPHVTIYHSQFGNGFFDFAVKSISAGGLTSNPHSSLDSTASVSEGWYLQWDVND